MKVYLLFNFLSSLYSNLCFTTANRKAIQISHAVRGQQKSAICTSIVCGCRWGSPCPSYSNDFLSGVLWVSERVQGAKCKHIGLGSHGLEYYFAEKLPSSDIELTIWTGRGLEKDMDTCWRSLRPWRLFDGVRVRTKVHLQVEHKDMWEHFEFERKLDERFVDWTRGGSVRSPQGLFGLTSFYYPAGSWPPCLMGSSQRARFALSSAVLTYSALHGKYLLCAAVGYPKALHGNENVLKIKVSVDRQFAQLPALPRFVCCSTAVQ
jgi:hypothetical protein